MARENTSNPESGFPCTGETENTNHSESGFTTHVDDKTLLVMNLEKPLKEFFYPLKNKAII